MKAMQEPSTIAASLNNDGVSTISKPHSAQTSKLRTRDYYLLSLAATLIFVLAQRPLAAQSAEDACHKGTWATCGVIIKRELDKRPSDPKRVVDLVGLWGEAYVTRFNELRKQGRIEKSTPDADKIFEEVNAKLNPIEIAKDKLEERLLKKYLSWLATIMEWADKPIAIVLKAFFNSSEIATDYQELRLMNDSIQKVAVSLLEPHMRSDWKDKLGIAVRAAGPQLRRP
jgi:hypothetical protein